MGKRFSIAKHCKYSNPNAYCAVFAREQAIGPRRW